MPVLHLLVEMAKHGFDIIVRVSPPLHVLAGDRKKLYGSWEWKWSDINVKTQLITD